MSRGPTPSAARRVPVGMRYMAVGALFFSLMSLLVKVAGQRLPSQEVVLGRAVVMGVLAYWGVRRAGMAIWGNQRKLLFARGLIGFAALSAFYYAYIHLPLADATVVQYTSPIFAGLVAVKVLDEKLRLREIVAVVAGLAGVVIVTRPPFLFGSAGEHLDTVAILIALGGAIASASAYVIVRKLRTTEAPLVIIFYLSVVSFVGSIPLALPHALWPTPTEWLALVGVGVTAYLGQIAITHGLHRERAGRATAVGYLQIVFAAVWGALAFAEYPDLFTVLGAVLIVGSTIFLARDGAPA
ncbi:MAG TPA: DMT family transporter [Longimicrobiaceae bacterium]|nr:DMT family transporter [Longimicrobiaceae bacterium]